MQPIYKTKLDNRYHHSYQVKFGSHSSFVISFLSKLEGKNIRIDTVPTQIRSRVLKQFFSWFYKIVNTSVSRLTCCDIGFSMHGLHYGFVNFYAPKCKTFRTIPEVDVDCEYTAVETEYVPPNINDSRTKTNTKFYSPTLRMLRENSIEAGLLALRNSQTSTRIESSCKPKGSLYYKLNFGDVAKVPCTLKQIRLVSPSIFLDLHRWEALHLVKYKLNYLLQNIGGEGKERLEHALAKHSVKIPMNFVENQIQTLATRYEPIFGKR